MKIAKLEVISKKEQFVKMMEEIREVRDEIINEDEARIIEEGMDLIEATFNLIFLCCDNQKILKQYWKELNTKLESRDGKTINIEKWVNL